MQELDFWYGCIGRYLAPDVEPAASTKIGVQTRVKKGIASNTLGAGIDAFYIASPGKSVIIGKLEMPNMPGLSFVPSEDGSGEKYIAQWLVNDAPLDAAWMIGVIGNANPNASMKRSQPPALCRFCAAGASFEFDLSIVRQAVVIMGDLDWKKDVAPALHTFQSRQQANAAGNSAKVESDNKTLQKAFTKAPALKYALLALCRLPLKPGSGEYEVLSWYNRVR